MFPKLDYTSHPAFAHLPSASADTSDRVDAWVAAIDTLLAELHAAPVPTPAPRLAELFEREVDPRLAHMLSAASATVAGIPRQLAALRSSFVAARQQLFDQALHVERRKQYAAVRGAVGARDESAQALNEHGVFATRLDPERIHRLRSHLEKHLAEADTAFRARPYHRCQLPLPRHGAHWSELQRLAADTGILAGLSDYDRHELEPFFCSLELSHADQTWWHGGYADQGLPTSRTVYFHNDQSFRILKMIVYLDDVAIDQGPFHFVPGSHRWLRSTTATQLVKMLDRGFAEQWSAESDAENPYYRP